MSGPRGGYLLYHREDDFEAFDDSVGIALWATLLAWANFGQSPSRLKRQQVQLEPGQVAIGMDELAKRLKLPKTTVYRRIASWTQAGRIRTSSGTQGTIITLCNWKEKQKPSDLDGTQQPERKWNASGTQVERKWNASGTQGTIITLCNWKEKQKPSDLDGTQVERKWNASGTQVEPSEVLSKKKELIKKKEYKVGNPADYPPLFLSLWDQYGEKGGKSKIGDKRRACKVFEKLKLTEAGIQELSKAIDNYFDHKEDWKSVQHFSTFLGTDWHEHLKPLSNGRAARYAFLKNEPSYDG